MPGKIFISYRREDDPSAAARVRDGLAATFGKSNLFMDVDNLLAGQRFDHELTKALAACDVLIAVIGQRWMDLLTEKTANRERDYVREEIAGALQRQIIVIPARVGREGQMPALPRPEDLPENVRELVLYQKHDLAHERFARDIAELAEAITSLRKQQAAGARPGFAKTAPWGWIGASAATAVTLAYGLAYFAGVPLPIPGAPASMTSTANTAHDAGSEKARLEQEAKLLAAQAGIKREQEARARAENEAAARAETERQAAEVKRRTELAAQVKRENDARLRAEAEARRRAEEAERQRIAAAKAAEERQRAEAQLKAEVEARARRDEEARVAAAEAQAASARKVETIAVANVETAPVRQLDKAPLKEAKPEDTHGLLGIWHCQSNEKQTVGQAVSTAVVIGTRTINRFDGKFYWSENTSNARLPAGGTLANARKQISKSKYWFEGNQLFGATYWRSDPLASKYGSTRPIKVGFKDKRMTFDSTVYFTHLGKQYISRSWGSCTK